MKTKRLRALLVAGLLSLAPAVTLTSCGGGGGGGGGAADTGSSDAPIAQDDHALASNLVGKSVVFSLGSDQTTINFNAANTVTGTMSDRNSTSAPSSFQGTYTNPIVVSQGGYALGKVTVYMNSLTSGKQQGFQITYKVDSGAFSISEAIWKVGSTTANVTQYCYFSK